MVRRVAITRRAFLFMFLHRHLPAPPIDMNLESAPLLLKRGDILSAERNVARILFCEIGVGLMKGQNKCR